MKKNIRENQNRLSRNNLRFARFMTTQSRSFVEKKLNYPKFTSSSLQHRE
jgi:hypothetical protein